MSIDEAELAGLSEDQLRKKYDSASRGTAGVSGRGSRDEWDSVAQEVARKKQKTESKKSKEKEYKF